MSKVAVVFWSGTGNTEAMAKAVAEGARVKGADVTVMGPGEFNSSRVSEFDAIGFGCPSMGAEVLEETEFEPMFAEVEGSLTGKRIGLFGSWGWGGGAWMLDWDARAKGKGAMLVADPVMCQEAPDATALQECKDLGAALAS